jgi:hypothetical protein
MPDEQDLGVLQTIRDLRKRDPFIPFRVVMTSGDDYTIADSELLAIGNSQLIYCFPHSDRIAHLRLNQIAAIEELGQNSAA